MPDSNQVPTFNLYKINFKKEKKYVCQDCSMRKSIVGVPFSWTAMQMFRLAASIWNTSIPDSPYWPSLAEESLHTVHKVRICI